MFSIAANIIRSGMQLQERYLVTRQLGKGGFGLTFEVDDGGKLKVIKILLTNYPKAVSLFQREAEVLSQLRHPGIPKVESDGYFTFLPEGNLEPLHCLVMEKIDGANLQDWLSCEQHISQEQAIDWLKQLAEILDKVHSQQYFHRDIKPSNIMLKPDGQLVLIDFGAVREVTETYLEKLDEKGVTGINSPGYTPVEQSEGEAVLQSDFFALGRTFVHLLTGKHPLKFIKNSQTGELIWREDAPQISESFANLLDYLMATFPGQRPQNANLILECLRAIESGVSDLEPSLPSVKIAPITKRSHTRRRIQFSLVALFLLALFGWRFGLPRIAIAYNDRGVEDYLANQPNQALLNFNTALRFDPDFAEAYYNRGAIYENLRDFDRARSEYQIAAKGGIPEAYNNLARLYILKKDYAAAIDLIGQGMKQAKVTKEMKYVLHKNLGWARLEQHRYPEAKEHLQIAINSDGDRAAAYCLLAQVLEAQGDMKGALVKWKSCRQYASQYKPDEDTWMGIADKRLAAGEKK
ncbi:protein kinase domain-containing protein [Argonema galeatum]|uniref:protein kinase domain-containing protein n=1 Tax=Argonema galeatum TaxID=2942762 RepID=UPI002013084E|nr:protein kinase [Argonema galeatum]MCL1466830.1 protein kinase [Argonema galeatum A003/A1]